LGKSAVDRIRAGVIEELCEPVLAIWIRAVGKKESQGVGVGINATTDW
jgi:hypothetical protein